MKLDLVRTDEDCEEWKMENFFFIICKNRYEETKLKKINPQVTQEEEKKTCLHVMEVKRTKEEKRYLVVCSVKLNTGVICASLT